LAVGFGIGERVGVGAVGAGGELGHDAAAEAGAAEVVAVVAFVADEFVDGGVAVEGCGEDRFEERSVVALAGGEVEGDRGAFVGDDRGDFGAQATATATDRLPRLRLRRRAATFFRRAPVPAVEMTPTLSAETG
jgi:hypothetical protein